jgi:hypothetical protein
MYPYVHSGRKSPYQLRKELAAALKAEKKAEAASARGKWRIIFGQTYCRVFSNVLKNGQQRVKLYGHVRLTPKQVKKKLEGAGYIVAKCENTFGGSVTAYVQPRAGE